MTCNRNWSGTADCRCSCNEIQHELGLTNIDFGFKGDNRYESNTVGFKYIGWAINFLQLRLFSRELPFKCSTTAQPQIASLNVKNKDEQFNYSNFKMQAPRLMRKTSILKPEINFLRASPQKDIESG